MTRPLVGPADEEFYAALADEMNDIGTPPWNPADWLPEYVERGARFAEANDLPWPPGLGDYDRYYERRNDANAR